MEGHNGEFGVREQEKRSKSVNHGPLNVPYSVEPSKAVVNWSTEANYRGKTLGVEPHKGIEYHYKEEREKCSDVTCRNQLQRSDF